MKRFNLASSVVFAIAAAMLMVGCEKTKPVSKGSCTFESVGEGKKMVACRDSIDDSELEWLSKTQTFGTITSLQIDAVKVTDDGLAHLAALKDLEHLTLWARGQGITDEGMEHIGKLTWLDELNLSGPYITDEGVARLAPLESLEGLWLVGVDFTGQGVAALNKMNQIEELGLSSRSEINDDTVRNLPDAPDLRELDISDLSYTRVTNESLEMLEKYPKLEELTISGEFDDEGMRHLARLKSLEKLNLSSPKITGEGVVHLNALPALEGLSLDGEELSLEHLKTFEPQSRMLYLSLIPRGLDAEVAAHLVEVAPSLEELYIPLGQEQLSKEFLDALTGFEHLKLLNMAYSEIADPQMIFLRAFEHLEILNLSGAVSDDALPSLARIDSLQELHLADGDLSEDGIKELAKTLPDCKITVR